MSAIGGGLRSVARLSKRQKIKNLTKRQKKEQTIAHPFYCLSKSQFYKKTKQKNNFTKRQKQKFYFSKRQNKHPFVLSVCQTLSICLSKRQSEQMYYIICVFCLCDKNKSFVCQKSNTKKIDKKTKHEQQQCALLVKKTKKSRRFLWIFTPFILHFYYIYVTSKAMQCYSRKAFTIFI